MYFCARKRIVIVVVGGLWFANDDVDEDEDLLGASKYNRSAAAEAEEERNLWPFANKEFNSHIVLNKCCCV